MGMKRRYLAVLMGIMVATTSVPAMVYAEDSKTETAADAANDESGEADASDENGDESQENVVLGEVKSVSDSEITIAVGTMKEMGQPGGDGQNGGAPDGNGQGGEAPSMLDYNYCGYSDHKAGKRYAAWRRWTEWRCVREAGR